MTKKESLLDINETQDYYVSKLSDIITGIDDRFEDLKEIDFTSPTGTGKTIMVAKLINTLPNYFFVITSLSRGQLRYQVEKKISELCKNDNYVVYGLNEFTKNTILQEDDIINILPDDKKIIWIRDEGHIATNRWQEVLRMRSSYIVNFSATNKNNNGIQCNFSHTMMLRTVTQNSGTPEDALDQLLEVKNIHKNINGYNPCALFRIIHDENLQRVFNECEKRGLTYINITEESYDMSDICEDDNQYDVIINKYRITEGVDLKRCHVIYMDSKPSNEATVVQIIGRARRNALFWRNDIDILAKSNEDLLDETRKCYVFYNIPETEVAQNDLGELTYSLCDTISVEALKPNIKINVTNGQMSNGLFVLELLGKNGTFAITYDEKLEANVVSNDTFYKERKRTYNPMVIDLSDEGFNIKKIFLKPNFLEYFEKRIRRTMDKIDNTKYVFFCIKKYLSRNNTENFNIDIDYWETFLKMDDKKTLVNRYKWADFLWRVPGVYHLYRLATEVSFRNTFNDQEKQEAYEYAKIDKVPEYFEKRNIFNSGMWYQAAELDFELKPYIEKIEYVSTQLAESISNDLDNAHNVIQITANKYKYSPHPFSMYLKNKGLSSFESLVHKIKTYSGKTLFGCSLDYWCNLIKDVNSFVELDNYETQLLTFADINRLLKLGYSDGQVKQYSRGKYNTRIGTASAVTVLKKIDYKTNIPVDVEKYSYTVYKDDFVSKYVSFIQTYNDYEIAVVGPDIMKYSDHHYIEDKPVTSKIDKYCKFNKFITNKYSKILEKCSTEYFKSKNDYGFDKKCNSCLGFCVEYYAKIKIYGEESFKPFIEQACLEAKTKEVDDVVRVRAAMIIYREEMKRCYGSTLAGIIPSLSIASLLRDNYSSFVNKVVELGNNTAKFVLDNMYNGSIDAMEKLYDPNLSVNHISALCDFLSKDTILDLKCTSSINEKHIKQVLSYYYLSTKRTDLDIKRLIVYDAPTNRYVKIDL